MGTSSTASPCYWRRLLLIPLVTPQPEIFNCAFVMLSIPRKAAQDHRNPRPRHLFDCFLPSHQPSHCYVADLLLIGILLLLLHTPSHTRDTHASLSFAEKPKKTSLFLPFFNYNSTTLTQSIMFSSNKAAQVAAISATLAASLVSAVTINTPSA